MAYGSTAVADSLLSPSSPWVTRIPLTPIERGWQHRRYSILREVLGPDFHGPSSSHTAAPQLIAYKAYSIIGGTPEVARVKLLNSFATTGDGHRTPVAIVAGLLGIGTTDPRTPNAMALAAQSGLNVEFVRIEDPAEHPNTLELNLHRGSLTLRMKAISIGGGNFEIIHAQCGAALAA